MDQWFEIGLDATRWLQANYPQLDGLMEFISAIGRYEFYLALMPVIYWCIDKRMGKHLTYLLAVTDLVNRSLKHMFRGPRPFWLDRSRPIGYDPGYGVPSGHVQSATILYFGLASWIGRRWVWLLALLMVALMAISRVYVGAHFVHDALAGLVVSLLILAAYWFWRRRLEARFEGRILGRRLLVAILIPVVIVAVYVLVLLILGPPDLTVPWADFLPLAETTAYADIATAFGTLLGLGLGFELERSWVRFRVDGSLIRRAARYLLGIVVTVIIWRGLGVAFEGIESLWLALPLRIFRYFIVGLWAAYYAPLVFVRLRLATAEPPPPITMKL